MYSFKSSVQETVIERGWYVHSCEQLERGCILLGRLFKRQLLSVDGMSIDGLGAGYSSPKKVDSGAYPK